MNRLIDSASPYLLQHANNPVDWYPWGEEAFQKAQAEDKPIFLSIGYAACHWCHVMARESFEDEATAKFMNKHFVNIKVDREELPHIDQAYMNAVIAMTGHGGWPLSVFLTPEKVPFFGGTYFPARSQYGLPAFLDILQAVVNAWKTEREKIIRGSEYFLQQINTAIKKQPPKYSVTLSLNYLKYSLSILEQSYDWQNGGWGNAPKFPQAMTLSFLAKMASRGEMQAQNMLNHALLAMAQGGMYDILGGGFSRYSTDACWRIPHFEKMLYDNALLAQAYLQGYLLTGNEFFRSVCEKTLDFIQREMSNSDGGFFSSLDADTEHEEGKFYLWTKQNLENTLTQAEFDIFTNIYELPDQGHFEGKFLIRRSGEITTYTQLSPELSASLESINAKLLNEREKRVKPQADKKVITSWNALSLWAFSEAGRYLENPVYINIAERNADFLLNHLMKDDQLLHVWYQGNATQFGYLEDYAALVNALLSLYQSTNQVKWFSTAKFLLDKLIAQFQDPNGGFFDTDPRVNDTPFAAQSNWQDNATPSANALTAFALLQMDAFTGDERYNQLAFNQISSIIEEAVKQPLYYAFWLQNASVADIPFVQVAVIGDPEHPNTQKMRKIVWEKYRPNVVYAESPYPPPPEAPVILHERPLRSKLPTAYVCEFFYCRYPTNKPEELAALLNKKSL